MRIRKLARFLKLTSSQVYKWNWNRHKARANAYNGISKKIRINMFKIEGDKSESNEEIKLFKVEKVREGCNNSRVDR